MKTCYNAKTKNLKIIIDKNNLFYFKNTIEEVYRLYFFNFKKGNLRKFYLNSFDLKDKKVKELKSICINEFNKVLSDLNKIKL